MMPQPQVVDRLHVSTGDLAAFCRRWHIAKLEVFGSVVRDDFRAESDVDFLVSFEPDRGPAGFDWFQLKEELSELVGRKVDLVDRRLVERSRNLYRRQHILSEATPVHGA
jgi:uncharacterized protein